MLETIFSLLLLVNGTTTPLTYICSGVATSSNCVNATPTASTTLTLSVNVPVETRIVKEWATTTIYATTTIEKIVYRPATTTRHWWEWNEAIGNTPTTTIRWIDRIIEKPVYVPVYQCPATTTPRWNKPIGNTPPVHYSTSTADYTRPPNKEKIEAKIEKLEIRQAKTIDRMNKMFERMINRLNKMLERI